MDSIFNQESINKYLSSEINAFSSKQKQAILFSLFDIANADDEFHSKEEEFFNQVGILIDYPTGDNILDEYLSADKNEVFESLNELTDQQKDWIIVAVLGMIHADGKVLEREIADASRFLGKLGITKTRIDEVMRINNLKIPN